MIEELTKQLNEHHERKLYRVRTVRNASSDLVNLSSNDYLGLSQHPKVIKTFQAAAKKYGVGSGASQLVCGYTELHRDCETAFAEFLGRDQALLFGNGYMANIGIIDALCGFGDHIFEDRYNHASLIDGARLSSGKLVRYEHKNTRDLRQRLEEKQKGKKLIVSDGVFSMYGDIAPLDRLSTISKKFNALLMVDDAHGVGVLGENGRGALELFNLSQEDVPLLICPLGKAFGGYGAIVSGSSMLIDFLLQFTRSGTYTTAIPPAMAAAAMTSLEVLQRESWRREKLTHLISFFRKAAKERDIALMDSTTAIQALLVGDPEPTTQLSEQLKQKGFWLHAMRPPSVPEGQSILRITLNCNHSEKELLKLLDSIQ